MSRMGSNNNARRPLRYAGYRLPTVAPHSPIVQRPCFKSGPHYIVIHASDVMGIPLRGYSETNEVGLDVVGCLTETISHLYCREGEAG